MIRGATFIHSNPGRAKADKTLENKAKTGGSKMEYGQKVGSKSHLRYKFHNTIQGVYELIRKFKIITS